MRFQNLQQLFEAMKNNDPILPSWDALPTFGKIPIAKTSEIWSWDDNKMIVGSCAYDIEIVDRTEL